MDTMYCFVDESGQDTKGRIFVVAVVIASKDEKDALETQLLEIERKTGKGLKKWHRSSREKRHAYLEAVVSIQSLKESVFCFIFKTMIDEFINRRVLRKNFGN